MTKSEFLSILSIHREQIKDYHQSPGWNRWALVGAFASLTWVFLDLHENDGVEYYDSFLILIGILWIEPIFRILTSVFGLWVDQNSNTYLKLSSELTNNTYSIFYTIGTYVGTILVLNINYQIDTWKLIVLNSYLVILLLFVALLVILAKFDIPLPENTSKHKVTKRSRNIAVTVFISISILAIWIVFDGVEDLRNVKTVKSALLFFGIYYVLKRILISYEDSSLLDSIDDLIEDVSFERISIEEGENQLRLILIGSEFKDLISPFVGEFVSSSQRFLIQMEFAKIRSQQFHKRENDSLKDHFEEQVKRDMKYVIIAERQFLKASKKLQSKLHYFQAFEEEKNEYKNVSKTFEEEQEKILTKKEELLILLEGIDWTE